MIVWKGLSLKIGVGPDSNKQRLEEDETHVGFARSHLYGEAAEEPPQRSLAAFQIR